MGFQGFVQPIFWRFLFKVAAVWDNYGDFLKVRKKLPSAYIPHQPRQAREDRRVGVLPTVTWRGGRVELNTVLTLNGHKVSTGHDRVVQTTNLSCATVHFQKLEAKVLSPLKVKTPQV